MTEFQQQGQQTGTRNETYDVIAILYHALQGAENCQTYIKDAKDEKVRQFFEQALNTQRQLADQGKEVLQKVLQKDTGGSSAFGWQSTQGQTTGTTSGQTQSTFTPPGTGGGGGGNF